MDKKLRFYTEKRLGKNAYSNFIRMFSVTNWIIIINVVIFAISSIASAFIGEKFEYFFALQANNFFSGMVWTVFTSMFLHANIGHLLANMISLFFIGNFIEKLIGRKRFFWFYLIGGIFGGLFYAFLSYYLGGITLVLGGSSFNLGEKVFMSPLTYAVGASGAIFALIGLLAILTPKNKVYLIAGPLIAVIIDAFLMSIFPNSNLISALSLFINIYIIFSIVLMFSFNSRLRKFALPVMMPFWLLPIVAIVPLIIIGLFVALPIGNTAHLGGLIVGLVYGLFLKNKYKQKTKYLSRVFSR